MDMIQKNADGTKCVHLTHYLCLSGKCFQTMISQKCPYVNIKHVVNRSLSGICFQTIFATHGVDTWSVCFVVWKMVPDDLKTHAVDIFMSYVFLVCRKYMSRRYQNPFMGKYIGMEPCQCFVSLKNVSGQCCNTSCFHQKKINHSIQTDVGHMTCQIQRVHCNKQCENM